MSERRLRELGTLVAENSVERCAFCHVPVSAGEHYPQCPMDADPDVVAMLRWAAGRAYSLEHEKPEGLGGLAQYVGDSIARYWAAITIKHVMRYIEDEFHVRLTDKGGWEYLEPEEA